MYGASCIGSFMKTVFLVIVVILCYAPSPAVADDWPQYLGPSRNGVSPETGWYENWPKGGPSTLWKKSIGHGYSSVSVVGDRAYTMGYKNGQDNVYCLDVNTGDVVWEYGYASKLMDKQHEGGPGATPTVDGELVFTYGKEGWLYCFDASSGEIEWFLDLRKAIGAKVPSWGFAGSPLVYGDVVIVDAGITAAFNRKNGDVVWKTEDYGAAYSSPVLFERSGREFFAVFPKYGLVVLDASDGREVGKQRWKTSYGVNAATPQVVEDMILVSSGYNTGAGVYRFEPEGTIDEVWKHKKLANHFNSSLFWEGHVYGFDEVTLRCIEFQSGEVKWSKEGLGKGSLLISDGKLLILSDRGELVVAEATPNRFAELTRAQVLGGRCWTAPVLSGSRVFCRNDTGSLVCLDLRGQ